MKLRFQAFLAAAVLLASIAAAGEMVEPSAYESSVNDLKVTFIDVGQGDSAFISTPLGKTVLIDSGCGPEPGIEGGHAAAEFLKKQNVGEIDYVILSHPHPDHGGGLREILGICKVDNFFDNGQTSIDFDIKSLRRLARKKGINCRTMRKGDVIELGAGTRLTVLAPPDGAVFKTENDGSLVLMFECGLTKILFPGDSQMDEEKWLVKHCGQVLGCDVLKSPHHGSHTSSYGVFLNRASPKAAVISCGLNNEYGHPHAVTLAKYKRRNIKIYRTDRDGNVTLTTNGSQFKIETARGRPVAAEKTDN